MKTICTISTMQDHVAAFRHSGKRIALVPTMGFLHEGHLSLIRIARAHADDVIVSIYVNPTQFGPKEDFKAYPRDLERDAACCAKEGADILFVPTDAEMYPEGYGTYVENTALSTGLCGRSRPGHFRGVTTIVSKLFQITTPDIAVFGEKDAQQLRILQQLVADLHFPVRIIPGPIVREADGLAMSSRNVYLTPEERRDSLSLHKALEQAAALYAGGERATAALHAVIEKTLRASATGEIDYIEIVDALTLQPVTELRQPTLIALAMRFGRARLLDNMTLGVRR